MEFITQLIDLALVELELEPQEVSELVIYGPGIGRVSSVRIGNQEVFFWLGDGRPEAYHVNCYDD